MREHVLRDTLRAAASVLYPSACAVCNAAVDFDEYLCASCEASAPRLTPPFCAKCSEAFGGAISETFTCANCAQRELHFECAVAAYRSRGVVRKVLHDFKYGRHRHLRHPLARWLCAALDDPRLTGRNFDVIIAVPLHPARQRERGFNQAALLAALLGRETGVRVDHTLERIRYTTTQTAYDRRERMRNLEGAFRLRRGMAVQGLRVLLIDDVLTTGSTLSECARVLKMAGAVSVHAATAARA